MGRGTTRSTYAQVIGERIRGRRKELDLTQRELAKLAGLNLTYVSKIETGAARVTVEALIAIAFALRIDLSALTYGLLPAGRRPHRWVLPASGDPPSIEL